MDPTELPAGANPAQVPAGPPPEGILPNFTSPSTLKTPVVTVNVAFLTIATLFVCLRLYTRKFINRLLGPEDCDYDTSAPPVLEIANLATDMCALALVTS